MVFLVSYPSLQLCCGRRVAVPGTVQVGKVDCIQAFVCADETSFLTKLHVILEIEWVYLTSYPIIIILKIAT